MMINVLNGTLDIGIGETAGAEQPAAGRQGAAARRADRKPARGAADLSRPRRSRASTWWCQVPRTGRAQGCVARGHRAAWKPACARRWPNRPFARVYGESGLIPVMLGHDAAHVAFTDEFAADITQSMKELGVRQMIARPADLHPGLARGRRCRWLTCRWPGASTDSLLSDAVGAAGVPRALGWAAGIIGALLCVRSVHVGNRARSRGAGFVVVAASCRHARASAPACCGPACDPRGVRAARAWLGYALATGLLVAASPPTPALAIGRNLLLVSALSALAVLGAVRPRVPHRHARRHAVRGRLRCRRCCRRSAHSPAAGRSRRRSSACCGASSAARCPASRRPSPWPCCCPSPIGMDPVTAIVLLASVYVGAEYGGSIPAILIRTPGTNSAAATTHRRLRDGPPGPRRRSPGHLPDGRVWSAASSGWWCWCWPPEPLALRGTGIHAHGLFRARRAGLSVIASLSGGSLLKGLLAARDRTDDRRWWASDPISGVSRFTFGSPDLLGGIKPILVMVGLFAVTEMLMPDHRAAVGPGRRRECTD